MLFKNIDVVNLYNTLDKYATYKLPQKINFAITKNLLNMSLSTEIYSKSLENIFSVYRQFILKDENGEPIRYENNLYVVDKEHSEDYFRELNELFDEEVELDIYHIDFSVFDYEDNDKYDVLSPSEIIELQKVLCDTEEDNKDG